MLFMSFLNKPKKIRAISQFKTLGEWWKEARNFYNPWSLISSDSTRVVDETIKQCNLLINDTDQCFAQARLKRLIQLQTSVRNWYIQHKNSHSDRITQIHMLWGWIQTEAHQLKISLNKLEPSALKDKPHKSLEIDSTHSVPNKTDTIYSNKHLTKNQSKYGREPQSYIHLYDWWMGISQLAFYQPRSSATKELDKIIKDFSDSVLIDYLAELRNLSWKIKIWKLSRQHSSERLGAIHLLEAYVKKEMDIQVENDNQVPILSTFNYAIFSFPFFDYSMLFDTLSFLAS